MLGINNFLSSEWMLCGRASTRRVNRGLIDVMIFGGGPWSGGSFCAAQTFGIPVTPNILAGK